MRVLIHAQHLSGVGHHVRSVEITRGLLLPDPRMSDQLFRAQRLAALGLVDSLAPDALGVGALADAIAAALRRPPPRHRLDLDGARRTRTLIESLSPRAARTPATVADA